tara:strand:+ start:349 stop:483 length:135 start_codon:yes stop_codon:yes gene_type:complete
VLINLIVKEKAWAPREHKKKVRSPDAFLTLQRIVVVDFANGEKQ